MTTQRKPLSSKMFLHRANSSKRSADGFIAAYRDYLVNGELAAKTSPVVAKVDANELQPDMALEEIKNMVLAHLIEKDARAAEIEMEKASEPTTSKAYVATAYNSKGEVQTRINGRGEEVAIVQAFNLERRAMEWLDRRLVLDCSSDCFALIVSTKTFDTDGNPITTTIIRKDALARMFPRAKSALTKRRPTNARLTSQMRAKNSHAHFSRG